MTTTAAAPPTCHNDRTPEPKDFLEEHDSGVPICMTTESVSENLGVSPTVAEEVITLALAMDKAIYDPESLDAAWQLFVRR